MKMLALLALGYGSLVALMYGAQTSLIFPGARLPSRPLDQPLQPKRLVVKPEEGVRLRGMLYPPRSGRDSVRLMIGFGGNAQDAEELGQDLAGRFADLYVAVFHYRGYGDSGGSPSEAALFADALAIHDRLEHTLRPETVVAFGASLGSGVAVYLSKHRPIDGMILATPYDSIEAVAKRAYPWLPVGLFLEHRFRSIDFMIGNRTPTAIIAAANDRVIKPARTDALRAATPHLVFDRTILGAGHADLYAMRAYDEALAAALKALLAAI
jgi:alpha-beta hydrolase superfamily lysophospholipase